MTTLDTIRSISSYYSGGTENNIAFKMYDSIQEAQKESQPTTDGKFQWDVIDSSLPQRLYHNVSVTDHIYQRNENLEKTYDTTNKYCDSFMAVLSSYMKQKGISMIRG